MVMVPGGQDNDGGENGSSHGSVRSEAGGQEGGDALGPDPLSEVGRAFRCRLCSCC